jgi:hypothetical protein
MEDLEQEVNPLFYLMPLVLPHMFKNQWGRVIAISSNPDRPSPAYSYNLGKSVKSLDGNYPTIAENAYCDSERRYAWYNQTATIEKILFS